MAEGLSQALLLSSQFCDGITATDIFATATATAATDSSNASGTAPAGSESSATGASATSTADVTSQSSQAEAPKAHTMLVREVVVVAVAGLVGGIMV